MTNHRQWDLRDLSRNGTSARACTRGLPALPPGRGNFFLAQDDFVSYRRGLGIVDYRQDNNQPIFLVNNQY